MKNNEFLFFIEISVYESSLGFVKFSYLLMDALQCQIYSADHWASINVLSDSFFPKIQLMYDDRRCSIRMEDFHYRVHRACSEQ